MSVCLEPLVLTEGKHTLWNWCSRLTISRLWALHSTGITSSSWKSIITQVSQFKLLLEFLQGDILAGNLSLAKGQVQAAIHCLFGQVSCHGKLALLSCGSALSAIAYLHTLFAALLFLNKSFHHSNISLQCHHEQRINLRIRKGSQAEN